jgi:peptidoglycan/xylan/chitin deacetylase (PgdA/CDA1 family)
MQFLKRWALKVGSAVSGLSRNGVRILLFHEIRASQLRAFDALIRFIADDGGFITPAEYEPCRRMNGVRYMVSFDDGFSSELEATRKVLDPLGIRAIFFVCPRFIGLSENEAAAFAMGPMRRADIREMKPEFQPLTWDNLALLSSRGHVIGSHGMSHLKLSELDNEKILEDEIISSGDLLEKRLGQPVEWFAYPFGAIHCINSRSLKIISQRYRYCCSGLRGINRADTNPLCLARENIDLDQTADLAHLAEIASGGLDPFYHFKRRRLLRMATHLD